ncbi:MAG: serine hydrolase [Pseudomonadota bacterium]|nr:serine hydrolase [Pseudomonadota bacterium]
MTTEPIPRAPSAAEPAEGLTRRRLGIHALAGTAAVVAAPALAQRAPVSPAAQAPTVADKVAWPATPATLAAQHRRAFGALPSRIEQQLPDVQSVAVLHRGHLAFEHYRSGVTAHTLQDTQSVTKSVLALLFGQAMADGAVRGVQELVATRLPAMLRQGADERVQRLRFEHLLTMTAGWAGEQTARRDRDDDLRQIVRRPFVADPGTRFAYDNGAANLLALALANVLRQPLSSYARQRLLAPLGIHRMAWRQGAQGHDLGALGLSLTTRGMARLGELVLAEGQWQGQALLPRDYVRAATERQNAGGYPLGNAYGYLWWVASTAPTRRAGRRTAMANGYGGQWIYVYPPLDMVVAATSRRTPDSMARGQAATLIRRDILPALQGLR